MGNLNDPKPLDNNKLKINELICDNEALKTQVKYLKEIIKKDGEYINELTKKLQNINDCEQCK
jgi:hypothetical protein